MKPFLRVNAVSLLYAIVFSIPVLLQLNAYRLNRLAGWSFEFIHMLTNVVIITQLIAGSIFFFVLTRKWLGKSKMNYLTAILWLPYFLFLTRGFGALFPFVHGGDQPAPVTGLLMLGGMLLYPLYILAINAASSLSGQGWPRQEPNEDASTSS